MADTESLFTQKNPPNTSTISSIKEYLHRPNKAKVFHLEAPPKEVMLNGEKVYEYHFKNPAGHFYIKEQNGVVQYIQDKKAPLNKELADAVCTLAVFASPSGVEFDTINTNPKIKDAVEDSITDSIKAKVARESIL